MNVWRMLRKIAMFFRRDLAIARSYRGAFVIELFSALFGSPRSTISPGLSRARNSRARCRRGELLRFRPGGPDVLRLPQRGAHCF